MPSDMSERPKGLRIPPPRADRPPLRTNVFNAMQKANTALTPLFPYVHAGALVPAGALLTGGPGKDYGQFYHHNSVDEVIVAFVTRGATLETGQVYNGGRVHGVNSFLKDQTKAGSFALFVITQRQLEQGPQPEAVTILCSSCRKEIFRGAYDAATPPGATELDHPFATVVMGPEILRRYNEDAKERTCPDCGHVNDVFPVHAWGWDRYAAQSAIMADARGEILAAARKGAV